MTRIIGGTAGGRRISTPRGAATRPTSDRVREALFSLIQSSAGPLAGLRFLDLYAGSGAVGLEAWSRGAGVVTMVESDRRTGALIRANATTLGCSAAKVLASPVATVLAGIAPTPYDVVFADPPYPLHTVEVEENLTALADNGWLVPGALVIVERGSRSTPITWPEGFVDARTKKYGESTLYIAHAP